MAEYLGSIKNFLTGTEISDLMGITEGTLVTGEDIEWLRFKTDEGRFFLYPSKAIRHSLSYNALRNKGQKPDGTGSKPFKQINAKGLNVDCKLINGSVNNSNGVATGTGGDWDKYIIPNFSKFPTNDITKYYNICDSYNTSAYVVNRGYDASNANVDSYYCGSSFTTDTVSSGRAWRPMLEISTPNLTIETSVYDLGDISLPQIISYNVGSSVQFSLIEKLDNNTVRTIDNQSSGEYTFSLSDYWESLPYGVHIITISVVDMFGIESYDKTITFNKIKTPITPIPANSTLTQAVNHMIELGKEIDYQETKLSNNLIAKGVEVLETDKMSNLIDKVGSIATGKKWASGTTSSANANATFYSITGGSVLNTYVEIIGLDFIPSLVLIKNPALNSYFSIILNSNVNLHNVPIHHRSGGITTAISSTSTTYTVDLSKSPAKFELGHIITPVYGSGTGNQGVIYDWIAYE